MKHIRHLSGKPGNAQNATVGQIISVIAQLMSVVGTALLAKEQA